MIRKWAVVPFEPKLIPKLTEIIHVGEQDSIVYVWTRDTTWLTAMEQKDYLIQIFATGETPPATADHIGSTQAGSYMWHVFHLRN